MRRYLVNLIHGMLLHPLLSLWYRWPPAWLLHWHDCTARYAWPETKALLTNATLTQVRRALKEASGVLWLQKDPAAVHALLQVQQALRALPEPNYERYDT